MKHNLFTLLFALMASIGTILAESGTCGDNLTWDLTNGVLTISGTGAMTGYHLYSDQAPWYSNRSSIISIVIHDGVTSIGNYAFCGCNNLASVAIPHSITSIGNSAFSGCSGLTSLTIPNSVNSIGTYAFQDLNSLNAVHIEDIASWCNITFPNDFANPLYYAHHLYLNNTEIKDLIIPGSVQNIGMLAFCGCHGLSSLTISDSVKSIGNYAFENCIGLTSITIPNSVTSIAGSTFKNCSGLTSITIPNSVTTIYGFAFSGCSSLTSIEIPNSVTCIANYAFANCTSLTSASISSRARIDGYAFSGCTGLTSVTNYATTPQSIASSVFNDVNKSACTLYVPAQSLDAYQTANVWKEFGNIVAIDEPQTGTITIAQALEMGKELAIKESSEEDFTIVGYVVGLETAYNTQYGNQSYWIADTPSGMATDALYVYRGASNKAVKKGYKVSIQSKIYRYDETIIETTEKAQVTILEETETNEPLILYGKCGAEGDSTNLSWQLNLNTWTLDVQGTGPMADSVRHLPWHSQNFWPYITTVNLPEGLTTIGMSAFDYCKKLSSIVIPESVEVIGKWAFYNCKSLTSLNMPESVYLIGAGAFYGCSLTEPLYNAHLFCFLPMNYSGSYSIQEGIVSVISYSFEGRKGVTEVILPASVLRLGYRTFYGCTGLTSITCAAVTPPEVQGEDFTDVDKTIPLYVPARSIERYAAADEWKEFTNIQAIQTQGIEETNDGAKATKFLRDGQVLILRSNKTFDLRGQEVK